MSHTHNLQDSDMRFLIDPSTRKIKNLSKKSNIVRSDHNSERFTFEIPRYIENHDMTLCDLVQVHYNNMDSRTSEEHKGIYTVDDVQADTSDDDKVIFSWLLSKNTSKAVGSLRFAIVFKCLDDAGVTTYAWNTTFNKDIKVLENLDNSDNIAEPTYEECRSEILKSLNIATGENHSSKTWEELTEMISGMFIALTPENWYEMEEESWE